MEEEISLSLSPWDWKWIVSLTIGYKTHIGRVRDVNEDSYAVLNRNQLHDQFDALAVVADGMGGGRGGDIASSIVAQTLPEAILEHLTERNGHSHAVDSDTILRNIITRANTLVWMRQVENSALGGMGTTCVSALVKENILTIGNVGDSRAYLLRQGQLQQLTDDHSEVWEQVKQGNMTREQARRSSYRNVITRFIGSQANVTPDVFSLPMEEGDTVLLCSDGLNTEINDNTIARVLASAPDAQTACDQLVDAALHNGGRDNITVVVFRYGAFTPLISLEQKPAEQPDEEDEDITDPAPMSRPRTGRGARGTVANAFEVVEDTPESDEPEPRLRIQGFEQEATEAQEARGGGGLAWTLIILLVFLALGEAVALYVTNSYRTVPAPRPDKTTTFPETVVAPPKIHTLSYGPAKAILSEPALRNSPLGYDPTSGTLYAFDLEGRALRILPTGKVTVVPGAPLDVTTPDTPKIRKKETFVALKFDPLGNRYQTSLEEKCLQKFTKEGTRIVPNIGKGTLIAPGDFVLDNDGNIFILDNHRLKKIAATETTESAPSKQNATPSITPEGTHDATP